MIREGGGSSLSALSYTYTAYDGQNAYLQVSDPTGLSGSGTASISQRYLYGQAVDQILAAETFTPTFDAHAVDWALTDNDGTVNNVVQYKSGTTVLVNHVEYTSCGDPTGSTVIIAAFAFGQSGMRYDEATGQYRTAARVYDPLTGRFDSNDEAKQGTNFSVACGDNWTGRSDPSGMWNVGYGNGSGFDGTVGSISGLASEDVPAPPSGPGPDPNQDLKDLGQQAQVLAVLQQSQANDLRSRAYDLTSYATKLGTAEGYAGGAYDRAIQDYNESWFPWTADSAYKRETQASYAMYQLATQQEELRQYLLANVDIARLMMGTGDNDDALMQIIGSQSGFGAHLSNLADVAYFNQHNNEIGLKPTVNPVEVAFVAVATPAFMATSLGSSLLPSAGDAAVNVAVEAPADALAATATSTVRDRVLANIAESQAARASSNFTQYLGTETMFGLTYDANAALAANPAIAQTVLSQAEYLAGQQSVGIARMQYGNAVERMVANQIENTPSLKRMFDYVGGPNATDFTGVGRFQGLNWDITTDTARQYAAHVARPYQPIVIPYSRPATFTNFP